MVDFITLLIYHNTINNHSCEVSLQSDQKHIFLFSWLPLWWPFRKCQALNAYNNIRPSFQVKFIQRKWCDNKTNKHLTSKKMV